MARLLKGLVIQDGERSPLAHDYRRSAAALVARCLFPGTCTLLKPMQATFMRWLGFRCLVCQLVSDLGGRDLREGFDAFFPARIQIPG